MTDEPEYLTPLQREYLARNPDAKVAEGTPKAKAPLVGVRGWLGFLAVSLFALGPFLTLAMTAKEISMAQSANPTLVGTDRWATVVSIMRITATLCCFVSIYAGWRLFKRHVPSTVPIVIACLWIAGPGLGMASLLTLDLLIGGSTALENGSVIGKPPLIASIIWTAYLLRSKRVKNTYYSGKPAPTEIGSAS